MKQCKKCQIDKDLSEYKSHKDTKDKLQTWCNDCRREYAISQYNKNKDKMNARRRQYWKENKK